jgi:hydrogenase maturation protease
LTGNIPDLLKELYKILIYGYGNPGRQDDGLGIEFVNKLESWSMDQGIRGVHFDTNYQLNIEDAEAISGMDLVIFADASREDIDSYEITKVDGINDVAFTTHEASPGYILKLCGDLFHTKPYTLLIHLKGYEWEFKEGLTEKAMENLEKALEFFREALAEPSFLFSLPLNLN